MSGLPIRSVVGGIMAVPAALFLAYVAVSFRGAYYFSTYVVVGTIYIVASFIAGRVMAQRIMPGTSGGRLFLWMLLGAVVAWGIALLTLTVLSATPLCVGQDNGDGNNTLGDCGFYVVLAAAFYSVPMVGLMGVASAVASWVMRRGRG